MVENDLPFSRQTAFRLIASAQDARLTNFAHVQLLPPAWGTLYELTKLDDTQFACAIKERIIRPDMQRADVTRFRQGGWEQPAPRLLPGQNVIGRRRPRRISCYNNHWETNRALRARYIPRS